MRTLLFILAFATTALRAQCPQVVASSDSICINDSVQLNASAGFSSYSWQPAANVSNPNIANPMAYSAGSYTVTATTAQVSPNLIYNADFSLGNVGFTSGQNYVPVYTPCNYDVSPDWFGLFPALTDHTPTNDNMFMSIDGCSPATVIWQQSNIAIQPNTNYNFSFWASRADQVQPIFEIQFTGNITGNAIMNTVTGIPYAGVWTWDQYGAPVWNSGPNTLLTITIVNLETNSFGNDFGLDDLYMDAACPITMDTIVIITTPQVDLGHTVYLCDQPTPTLDPGISNATYHWNTGDTTQSITPISSGTYWVEVSVAGCQTVLDSVDVVGNSIESIVYFPNSFTPNKDGKNEYFSGVSETTTFFHLQIFNRWGELIFETNNIQTGWDGTYKGKIVQEDTYVYVAEYAFDCGNGVHKKKIGHINVLR
jgi:gliding motility-associated-like protein